MGIGKVRFFSFKTKKLCLFIFAFVLFLQSATVTPVAETTVYHSVKTDSKKIAITFDDGPHPIQTDQILELLDEYDAKATFFMVGVNIVNYPDVAKRVLSKGHEIGNHTFSHLHIKNASETLLLDELGKCEDALEELCEYRPHLFRPPEGAINDYIRHSADNEDYRVILWSIDTRDWEVKNAAQIVKTVLDRIQPGDIILMHDYIGHKSQTVEAVRCLLPQLIEQGFEPVTVSQLLGLN